MVWGCLIIFHLSALIGIPYTAHYLATNCGGTLNLLEAARHYGVERFVHTSTSETYGTAQYTPIDEAHPLRGQSPYAASKIGAEEERVRPEPVRSWNSSVTTARPRNCLAGNPG
jgi:nucleoside-diphosphate-sugar epimerase